MLLFTGDHDAHKVDDDTNQVANNERANCLEARQWIAGVFCPEVDDDGEEKGKDCTR